MRYIKKCFFNIKSLILILFLIVTPFQYCFCGNIIRKTIEIAEISATIEEITFTSDHGVLKNNSKTWGGGGDIYDQPEWKKGSVVNYPITQNINNILTTNVKLRVNPSELKKFKLTGRVTNNNKNTGTSEPEFIEEKRECSSGYCTLTMKQNRIIESQKYVGKISISISWFLSYENKNGTLFKKNIDKTGPHVIYLLYGNPIESFPVLYDGLTIIANNALTVKRIEKVFSICREINPSGIGENDPYSTVKLLHKYLITHEIPYFKRSGEFPVIPIWELFNNQIGGDCIAQSNLLMHMVKIIGISDSSIDKIYASTDTNFNTIELISIGSNGSNYTDCYVGVGENIGKEKPYYVVHQYEGVFIFKKKYFLGQMENQIIVNSPHEVHNHFAEPINNKKWLLYFWRNPKTKEFKCFNKYKKKYDKIEEVPIEECIPLP